VSKSKVKKATNRGIKKRREEKRREEKRREEKRREEKRRNCIFRAVQLCHNYCC
jgi:hypothetical protein